MDLRKTIDKNKIESLLFSAVGHLLSIQKSPDECMSQLFEEVQKQHIFDDGKKFVDLVPKFSTKRILQEFLLIKNRFDFNLKNFVERNFYDLSLDDNKIIIIKPDLSIEQYISELWNVLERRNLRNQSSLIALPYSYIVPGARFNEQYYWDSYFIMLGLASEGRWDMVEGMVKNFVYMMRKFGFIPNANRTYLSSRSQPPFFSHMVRLLSTHKGSFVLVEYLPYLLKEYKFWMKGTSKNLFKKEGVFDRAVQMENGAVLNRYFDNKVKPRTESFSEDVGTAENLMKFEADKLYLDIRSCTESGWDFSSRWCSNKDDIRTIHTTDIIPVDLNCLLYQLEMTIIEAYEIIKQPFLASKFRKLSKKRADAILNYCWHEEIGFFMDYNFLHNKISNRLSLAGVFPLYAKIASAKQAKSVADIIKNDFLKEGGLVSTLIDNSQQWDSPNGWAPLHFIVIQGLRNYGYYDLANEIRKRWINTNIVVFQSKYKLFEKYNVVNVGELANGGEYPLQEGFGWTNGVFEVLMAEINE